MRATRQKRRASRGAVLACVALVVAACGSGQGGMPLAQAEAPPPASAAAPVTAVPDCEPGAPVAQLQAAFPALPAMPYLLALVQAPNDSSRWYAVRQSGEIHTFANNAAASELGTFIDLRERVRCCGENGLLGLAFDPDFPQNGQFYLSYSDTNGHSVVSRFTFNGTLPVPLSSEEVIFTHQQPARNHNGGSIAFGPDGYLYLGFGDGGGAGDPHGNGQNPQTLLGTILRIDVAGGGAGYRVPASNPFVGKPAVLDEIYAYGLRNPWRFSFDRHSGALWLADVGQNAFEEVDIIEPGKNYGWPIMEALHCYQSDSCADQGLSAPVLEYDHSEGASITGGFVYRGPTIAALSGQYIYGDFVSGRIWRALAQGEGSYRAQKLLDSGLAISSFAEDLAGELYVLNLLGGAGAGVYRLLPAEPAGACAAAH